MGERLVHQHDRPILAERAGECCALAHAPGQSGRTIIEAIGEADFLEQGASAPLGDSQGCAVATQAIAQQDVVEDREPRQQQIGLGHVGDGLRSRRVRQQAGQPAQQRGLADSGTAEQAGRASGREFQRQIAGNQTIAEGDARITHEKGRSSRQVRHQSLRRY
jgi:hypothetical protein